MATHQLLLLMATADRGLQVKPTVVSAPTMAPTEERIEEAEGLLAFSTELQQ